LHHGCQEFLASSRQGGPSILPSLVSSISPCNHNDSFPIHSVPLLICMTLPAGKVIHHVTAVLVEFHFCSSHLAAVDS
jgi:hypothetical protein